jgi:hypothetical protein
MHTPKLTAYNSVTEPSKIPRLQNVWGYVVALADHYGNRTFSAKVAGLNDHKGILEVAWRSEPTEGEKEFFLRAWKSSIGDNSDQVEHRVEK